MMKRAALVGCLALWIASLTAVAQESGNGRETTNFLSLTGSADWEWFRADGVAAGTSSTFDAFRQRYSVDLAGSIWDHRFNRFAVGLDLYRDSRNVDGDSMTANSVGYRADSTFFPTRPFPLRLFARRSTIQSSGAALADSDRETAAWGAEWNVTTRRQQNARLQFDSTTYDLLSPVALRERRKTGTVELSQRFRRRETSFRYAYSDQRELVRDTDFTRNEIMLTDRTRFDSGIVLLLNGTHMMSDARFSTGELDNLTQSRVSTVLDVPRKKRVGFNFGYDYNKNAGRFVNSTSHLFRGDARVLLGQHWEAVAGVSTDTLDSATASTTLTQDTTGVNLGLRYNRDWSHFELATAYTFGLNRSSFDIQPDRTLTSHSFALHVRSPLRGGAALFGSLTVRQDENDVTGVGYSFDEDVARLGVEWDLGKRFRGRIESYRRDATYDTFQFGVQDSTEYGIETTLAHDRGGVSLTASTRKGISEFTPDPAGGGPFVPGTDLVSRSDILGAGAQWRFLRRLTFRARVRYENREFTSIGKETILSYHPELEWRPGVWRLIFGITHYGRDNTESFEQDTVLLKASRRFS